MKPHDEMDELIDAAVAGYSSAEPLRGLEARALRRVETAGPARWHGWKFPSAIAFPAIAALLVAAFAARVWRQDATPAPQAPRAIATLRPPVITAPSPASPQKVSARRGHRVRAQALPKIEQFPAPSPLTPEENALVAWARRAPAEAREAFAALRAQAENPVAIAPIQIPPMQDENAQ